MFMLRNSLAGPQAVQLTLSKQLARLHARQVEGPTVFRAGGGREGNAMQCNIGEVKGELTERVPCVEQKTGRNEMRW
jgi:hypothetical protein